ncbi:MAG: TIGR00159 family protein [Verrucomicrobiales bacterium]|nr:TIGR00159 family protein [Verrucomicrobiales bacterium]
MKPVLDFIAENWRHGLEILLLWFIIYQSYRYFRATRGARIFTGLVGLWIGLTLLSSFLDLNVIGWILEKIAVFLAVALVVIFQPELRRALAELGSHRWFSSFGRAAEKELTEDIVEIVKTLSRKRIGALIAIQRSIDLKPYLETGVSIDCRISPELIQTIFHSGTPLHDGGLILRLGDERILGAGCVFPLNQREQKDRSIGLRHRAAMGITEESDAIALVVSEETGAISIASEGHLERNLDPDHLKDRLNALLFEPEDDADEDDSPAGLERPLASTAD